MGSPEVIVLDTHALVWWINDPGQLSKTAQAVIEEARKNKTLYVSCISSWEIALLVQRNRLQLTLDVRDWLARCEALPFVTFMPVTTAIAVESTRLPDFPHADPADRIIVATAQSLGARLVTKDEKIHLYRNLQSVW
ncbi:MAG: type II toxin-antitoxin system VapC family toxin [Trichlorobacter sp.]|jgi:PIN domain nuclease of toxin-antitoxin system